MGAGLDEILDQMAAKKPRIPPTFTRSLEPTNPPILLDGEWWGYSDGQWELVLDDDELAEIDRILAEDRWVEVEFAPNGDFYKIDGRLVNPDGSPLKRPAHRGAKRGKKSSRRTR